MSYWSSPTSHAIPHHEKILAPLPPYTPAVPPPSKWSAVESLGNVHHHEEEEVVVMVMVLHPWAYVSYVPRMLSVVRKMGNKRRVGPPVRALAYVYYPTEWSAPMPSARRCHLQRTSEEKSRRKRMAVTTTTKTKWWWWWWWWSSAAPPRTRQKTKPIGHVFPSWGRQPSRNTTHPDDPQACGSVAWRRGGGGVAAAALHGLPMRMREFAPRRHASFAALSCSRLPFLLLLLLHMSPPTISVLHIRPTGKWSREYHEVVFEAPTVHEVDPTPRDRKKKKTKKRVVVEEEDAVREQRQDTPDHPYQSYYEWGSYEEGEGKKNDRSAAMRRGSVGRRWTVPIPLWLPLAHEWRSPCTPL